MHLGTNNLYFRSRKQTINTSIVFLGPFMMSLQDKKGDIIAYYMLYTSMMLAKFDEAAFGLSH